MPQCFGPSGQDKHGHVLNGSREEIGKVSITPTTLQLIYKERAGEREKKGDLIKPHPNVLYLHLGKASVFVMGCAGRNPLERYRERT